MFRNALSLVNRDYMKKERRSLSSAERRQTYAPAVHATAPDSDRFGRRIGPLWLTVAQLSRRWQLSRKTIYKFIDARILPAWKVGSHLYRVAMDDILQFEQRPPSSAPAERSRSISSRD
jgi:excisionase family DNA binding protein